ncbi:pyridoxamine 5'-phosphate oxidase family protein [Phenylobacterium sp.]|uniref:pyridoxamine 5'-phosphate oxidase family protein n=1 Tax=Phenylobacterium sp. TaxID=1871053 RepID=UPI00286B3C2A|nr:pyridoxamine 5'-phosphate oxidase family protein [Phenylobacterium sp.]
MDPFHPNERAAQRRAGLMALPTGAGIRDFMPDQHRAFFEGLTYLFAGAVEPDGWPAATMLTGAPGFIASPDEHTLRLAVRPDPADPAQALLTPGAQMGLLGLDLSNRRRNRANGRIAAAHDGIAIVIDQSFGNCPQYIQTRSVEAVARSPGPLERFAGLDADARVTIAAADTFFVATAAQGENGGVDISHRGGRPGFVRIEHDVLTIPDFRGNRFFNTLGNLLADPRAALLFPDFETGDLTQLQGRAEVLWDQAGLEGAERLWRFTVERGWRRRAAIPLRWTFGDYSPTTLATGTWG